MWLNSRALEEAGIDPDRKMDNGVNVDVYKRQDTKSRDIIVAHEAFGYLCNAYDLTQLAIEGLTPDSEPDPAKMQEVIEYAKKYDIHTIFFEELASPKVADVYKRQG